MVTVLAGGAYVPVRGSQKVSLCREGVRTMGCLALNASFEPLTIIPARRAIRLVLDQKAEILEMDPGRAFRSPRTELPFPTCIPVSTAAVIGGNSRAGSS